MSNCVKNAIEQLRPFLKAGNLGNGLKGEAIEPQPGEDMYIDKPGIISNVTQTTVHGFGDFLIEKIKVDFDKPLFDIIVKIPKTTSHGISENVYSYGGFFNTMSKSKYTTVTKNWRMRITLKGKHEIRKGETYIKWTSVNIVPRILQIETKLIDAFPDKAINDAVNLMMNESIDLIVPDVEKATVVAQSKCSP